jgi:hypothetical protein
MVITGLDVETLKNILENINTPEMLDSHPWTSRPFTLDAVMRNYTLRNVSPGEQLVGALQEMFFKIMPSTPPRRGKRLDTRWAEFGILAAQYFAPLKFGTSVPNSLRDAWGKIDQVILFYVQERDGKAVSEDETSLYKLVGNEREAAPASTLSDWHCKGIQRLADAILVHEQYLEKLPLHQSESTIAPTEELIQPPPQLRSFRSGLAKVSKSLFIFLGALVLIALILGALKVKRMYDLALLLKADVTQLRGLMNSSPSLEEVGQGGSDISKLRRDFGELKDEAQPILWLGPWLKWVPTYGGDLAASEDLLKLTDLLLNSAEKAYTAFQPLLTVLDDGSTPDPSKVVALLSQAQPELLQARQSFDEALQLRRDLNLEQFSPKTRLLIEQYLDRLMPVMDDGLSVGLALPNLLGAASDGPKTYLILAQNEDELRSTGGYLTAAGTLVMENGRVLNLRFSNSAELDNWAMPYPSAPWQLREYMDSPVLVLRDANWFTNFPTTASYAEFLYAYHDSRSVDGVIAFDQHMLMLVLQALGPLQVEGVPYLIDAENVATYMRSAKSLPQGQPVPEGWGRKEFMNKITSAIFAKVFQGGDISWEKLANALFQGLNERHILLVLDDPMLAPVIASHGWDGAVHPGVGDFLMVVDSNIGFSKTNAMVETDLTYDVNLTDPALPTSQLSVMHRNNSSADVVCIPFDYPMRSGEEDYAINACYWNYMRVYTPAGTILLDASPQVVSESGTMLNPGVPGRVDVLAEKDEIKGMQAFGTLMAIPGDEALTTGFHFGLPSTIVSGIPGSKSLTYHLEVKKQPGTLAIPLTIRIHLPQGATIQSTSPDAIVQGNYVLFATNLRIDQEFYIIFSQK